MTNWADKDFIPRPVETTSLMDSQKKVREALLKVEQAIRTDFGITLNIGVEVECNIYPADRHGSEFLEKHHGGDQAHNPLHISKNKTLQQMPSYFPKIDSFQHIYKETGNYQYELVFSPAKSAVAIADAVQTTKEELRSVLGRRRLNIGFHPLGIDEGQKPKDYTNGMHLNVSLATETNPNLFTSPDRITPNTYAPRPPISSAERACETLVDATLPILDEATLLFAPQTASYKRLKEGMPGTPPYEIANNGERGGAIRGKYKHKDKERLECRLSGSDADPQQALLGLLTAIYASLKENGAKVVDDKLVLETASDTCPKSLGLISENIEVALQKFKSGTRFRDTLNSISDGMGDDIVATIAAQAEKHIASVKAQRNF